MTEITPFSPLFSDCNLLTTDGHRLYGHRFALFRYKEFRELLNTLQTGNVTNIATRYTRRQLDILIPCIYDHYSNEQMNKIVTDTEVTAPFSSPDSNLCVIFPDPLKLSEIVDLTLKLHNVEDPIAEKLLIKLCKHIWTSILNYRLESDFFTTFDKLIRVKMCSIKKGFLILNHPPEFFKLFDSTTVIQFINNCIFELPDTTKLSFVIKWSCIYKSQKSEKEAYLERYAVYKSITSGSIWDLDFRTLDNVFIEKILQYGLCPIFLRGLVSIRHDKGYAPYGEGSTEKQVVKDTKKKEIRLPAKKEIISSEEEDVVDV